MKTRKSVRRKAPRYQIITARLLADIQSGRYPVGTLLPTEIELCKIFRTSRHTMREALRTITACGLVVRRPRVGSMVIASQQPSVFTQSIVSLEVMRNYPPDTYRENVGAEHIVAEGELAALLRCAPGTPWFHIMVLRRANESATPISWNDVYILPRYAGVVRSRGRARLLVYEQIEQMYGETVEHVQIEMFASRVAAKQVRILKVAADSPVLKVVHRYAGKSGQVFQITVSTHPEKRYTYSLDLRRELQSGR